MDTMTTYNTAQGMAKILEKTFPAGGALASISKTRIEQYGECVGPAELLRTMADMIEIVPVVDEGATVEESAQAEPEEAPVE